MLTIRNRIIIIIVAALFFISCPLTLLVSHPADGGGNENRVLFDMGNGETRWFTAENGATYDDVFRETARANGMEYSGSGDGLTIDGVTKTTIGSTTDTGGSVSAPGTTGMTVDSVWTAYLWDSVMKQWSEIPDLSQAYGSEDIAMAFHVSGYKPIETPDFPSSWTMVRGDSEQRGRQDGVVMQDRGAGVDWAISRGETSGAYSSALYVEDHVFVKFGKGNRYIDAAVVCYRLDGSNEPSEMKKWEFTYDGHSSYETATPVIVGEYIFIQTGMGDIHKIPWREGPGDGNVNVETMTAPIPAVSDKTDLKGDSYGPGIGSMVYNSGALYFTANNGMIYCLNLDLELLWSAQMDGYTYYISPTVSGDYLYTGSRDGCLYVVDKKNGSIFEKIHVYSTTINGREYGSVSAPVVFENGNRHTIVFSVSDGRGMGSVIGGVAVYELDPTKPSSQRLKKISLDVESFGLVGNYVLPIDHSDFRGVLLVGSKGIFRVDVRGNATLLNSDTYWIKAPPLLVNGTSIFVPSYTPSRPIFELDLDGNILSEYVHNSKVKNYCMAPLVFVPGPGGWVLFHNNDSGIVVIGGTLPDYVPPSPAVGMALWQIFMILVCTLLTVLLVIYAVLRFMKGIDRPFAYIHKVMTDYIKSDKLGHNTRSKHRLLVALMIGASLTVTVFVVCLCVGPTVVLHPGEMVSSLMSAISKGGGGLSYNELMVYESRLPRTLAALAVGIGLSIAGSMYQAIIRNPLVDPYIMGVSAGAGTAAVAVIAFDFTFFGLFASHSMYLTAFTAMIGGLIAFFATMFIAERAGGSSLNYVLAGVVIGLAFSAVQTLMLSMAGRNVSNALSWLFGSFANVSWNHVWLILFPALALSIVPLIWAKEFNLVLLGEDQAQQMGLNVRNFTRIMLILASVLTSVCVAFVGIIGFVGLVVPHLCRMVLGGDHRLVLPASIALGGGLMMAADLAARMLYHGQELPVGAITTIIGVPVFAYLLIKRGRMYDG